MPVRDLDAREVENTVCALCVRAVSVLDQDVLASYASAREKEASPLGREILSEMEQNARAAVEHGLPACQDTGMAVVFLDMGQDIHVVGGGLHDAVNQGVRRGYAQARCRASVLDFMTRENTRDNTPAVMHTEIVPGDRLDILLMVKGFGAENYSRVALFPPHVGMEGVKQFVVETVERAGSSACPPVVVGVGLGGTMEKAALMAKRVLNRPLHQNHPDGAVAELENELLGSINRLGIGPQGLGGTQTALAVHVETYPTHIASLPVAVNLQCHSHRHASATL